MEGVSGVSKEAIEWANSFPILPDEQKKLDKIFDFSNKLIPYERFDQTMWILSCKKTRWKSDHTQILQKIVDYGLQQARNHIYDPNAVSLDPFQTKKENTKKFWNSVGNFFISLAKMSNDEISSVMKNNKTMTLVDGVGVNYRILLITGENRRILYNMYEKNGAWYFPGRKTWVRGGWEYCIKR